MVERQSALDIKQLLVIFIKKYRSIFLYHELYHALYQIRAFWRRCYFAGEVLAASPIHTNINLSIGKTDLGAFCRERQLRARCRSVDFFLRAFAARKLLRRGEAAAASQREMRSFRQNAENLNP